MGNLWKSAWCCLLALYLFLFHFSRFQVLAASHTNQGREISQNQARRSVNVQLEKWEYIPTTPGCAIQHSVAAGADINGDGFADLLVGESVFESGKGRVLVFFGAWNGLPPEPSRTIAAPPGADEFGAIVRTLGDTDGDGLEDVYVSWKRGKLLAGGIYTGSMSQGFSLIPWLGEHSPVPIGDVNGDSFADVAVWQPGKGEIIEVFYGSKAGISFASPTILRGEPPGSSFGAAIAGRCDVNGDGFGDVIVGSPLFDGRYRRSGKACLFLGSNAGISSRAAWSASYDLPAEAGVDDVHEQLFGQAVAAAGDVNGDGYDDALVSAPFAERTDRNEGIVFLFLGCREGLQKEPAWIAESNQAQAIFGNAISSAGDVNADGFNDVLVGMPNATDGQASEGAVAVYCGSKRGLSRLPQGIIESDHSHEAIGSLVACAGDVNGDGYSDVLLVGPGFERRDAKGLAKYGRAVVYYGSARGLPFRHGLRLNKPLLTAVQQRLDIYRARFGTVVYWSPFAALLSIIIGVFLLIQGRLRKRIRELVDQNRSLVRTEERSRIARDFHDHLGADLTQIFFSARAANTPAVNGNLQDHLQSIALSATKALETIDELIWVTDPARDSLESLLSAFADFTTGFLSKAGITCQLDFTRDVPNITLAAQVRHDLLSVVKELIRNAAKHSGASEVRLTVRITEAAVSIVVIDNGKGFSDCINSNAARNGLNNVRGRAERLGGEFSIRPNPSTSGSSCEVRLPFGTT